jgi:predicted pyridoxine 5'-phosphate oxidase superfamily flavin-nucleotide-binding protein
MQMVAEYGGANVVVELQDEGTLRFLIAEKASGISANNLGPERAREIAEFVCNHYGSMGSIDTVEVAFEIRRDGSVVDATGQVAYAFARNDLACSGR